MTDTSKQFSGYWTTHKERRSFITRLGCPLFLPVNSLLQVDHLQLLLPFFLPLQQLLHVCNSSCCSFQLCSCGAAAAADFLPSSVRETTLNQIKHIPISLNAHMQLQNITQSDTTQISPHVFSWH
jgi:hypothetical protein